MQKGQYSSAGIQLSPGIRMNVRSYVRVPDGEVDRGLGPKPFEAPHGKAACARRAMTMPRTYALILLGVAFTAFLFLGVAKSARKSKLSAAITRLDTQIMETVRSNSQLTVEVMEARDSARIGYEAVQHIGMIAAAGVDSVPVTAPDTRPNEKIFSSQTGNSPLPAAAGILSGSR